MPRRLDWLQCARAFASCYVALFHASTRLDKAYGIPLTTSPLRFFHHGVSGVDLFFVISGFIILRVHGSQVGKPEYIPSYALRRITRIYPPYWVLFFALIPMYIGFSAGEDYKRNIWNIVANIFLLPTSPKPIVGVAWTLNLEIIFYLAFATLLWSRKIGSLVFAVWSALVLVSAVHPWGGGWATQAWFDPHFIHFFLGMTVAFLLAHRPESGHPAALLAPGSIIFFGAFVFHPDASAPETLAYTLTLSVGAALLIWGAVRLDVAGAPAPAILVKLGDATYAIYLFHWLVGWGLDAVCHKLHLYAKIPEVLLFPGFVVAMVGGGVLAHILIERPLLALSSRWFGAILKGPRPIAAPAR